MPVKLPRSPCSANIVSGFFIPENVSLNHQALPNCMRILSSPPWKDPQSAATASQSASFRL